MKDNEGYTSFWGLLRAIGFGPAAGVCGLLLLGLGLWSYIALLAWDFFKFNWDTAAVIGLSCCLGALLVSALMEEGK